MRNLLSLLFLVFASIGHAQVVINEYQCSNLNTVTDNLGNTEDWFELYNTTSNAIDLSGYFLSDKVGNPTKWEIPSGTLNANGRLLIFASGRDGVFGGETHTSFKLKQTTDEYIMISTPTGVIIDSIKINPTFPGHSFGRASDGGTTWGVFANPTPDATNSGTVQQYAQTPTFSLPAGGYGLASTLSLTTIDSNVEIRYTTDGSEPIASSNLYAAPIAIANTQVIRAKAFSTNGSLLNSFTETNTYFINETHHVRVVSIAGDEVDELIDDGDLFVEPPGSFELFDANLSFKSEATGEFNKHGNDSWAYPQRGFDFIARDQLGINHAIEDQIFNGKSRDEFQRLIIKGAASDNYPFEFGGAHIRDAFVQSLSQVGRLKMDERSHESCVLYLNGEYWGVYEIREKVDDADFTKYYYDQDANNIDFIKTWGNTWADYGDMNEWTDLYNFIINNDMTVPANYNYVDSLFNWQSLVDYTVLNSYTVCKDWLNWNTAWWNGKNPEGDKKKWRYALWDMDAVFGHYVNFTGIPDESMEADPCNVETLDPDFSDPEGHMQILQKLMENEEVNQWYVSRYIDLGNTIFSCDFMINHLDSLVAIIDPEMQKHCNRWGGSYNGWLNNVQAFKDSINQRCVSLSEGMEDCYQVVGPYEIVVMVDPPLTGDAKINSITPPSYPFVGDYYTNIDVLLKANAAQGFMFDSWEIKQHPDSLAPNPYLEEATFRLGGIDTIIAHFVPEGSKITFVVEPTGAGEIELNNAALNTYPKDTVFTPNTTINLNAVANSAYEFERWKANQHTFSPDNISNTTNVTVNQKDTIWAYFQPKPLEIMFTANPTSSGELILNGSTLAMLPHSESYYPGDTVRVEALSFENSNFLNWTAENHTISNSTLDSSIWFVVLATDTIIANFELNGSALELPLVFSPNGDNTNDAFLPLVNSNIFEPSLTIVDRWGRKVFETTDLELGWDGTKDGKEVASGTYFYTITYLDDQNTSQSKSGIFTLLK